MSDSAAKRVWKHLGAIALVALVVAAAVMFWPRSTPYARFMRQPPDYYVQLAQACEALRQAHPVGTNAQVSLSVHDPALPPIVKELNPDEILLHPDRLWMGVGVDRNSFGVLWEPDKSASNAWVLMADYDGRMHIVYKQVRP